MLIAGAKRHAKEVYDLFCQGGNETNLVFFDDLSNDIDGKLFNKYHVIRTLDEVENHFSLNDPNFILAAGNPKIRKLIADKLTHRGGNLTSIISNFAQIGSYNVILETGLNIMNNVMISSDTMVGIGSLINAYVSIHHDVKIGAYCEVSPHAVLLGGCVLGNFVSVGANATILPNVSIGSNSIIGAGAVVTTNIPPNCTAVGVPARIIKKL